MEIDQAIANLINNDPGMLIPIIAIGGGMIFAFCIITLTMVTSTIRSKHIEASRREIAAYIAEGSMSPDEGERLLNAGKSAKDSCC